MTEREISPFDLMKNASYDKREIDAEIKEKHNQFLANKNFSLFYDSILYANMMNIAHNISDEMNYDFYFNALPKRKRYAKWPNNSKDKKLLIDKIKIHFNCGKAEAELYYRNMTEGDIEYINNYIKI